MLSGGKWVVIRQCKRQNSTAGRPMLAGPSGSGTIREISEVMMETQSIRLTDFIYGVKCSVESATGIIRYVKYFQGLPEMDTKRVHSTTEGCPTRHQCGGGFALSVQECWSIALIWRRPASICSDRRKTFCFRE